MGTGRPPSVGISGANINDSQTLIPLVQGIPPGGGSLGPLAGTIAVTDEMAAEFTRSDELMWDPVARAHAAGALRPDATAMDVSLLIEQLGRSPLIEQLDRQGRTDLIDAARDARKRTIAIALDGLRSDHPRLSGTTPSPALLADRWEHASTDSATPDR